MEKLWIVDEFMAVLLELVVMVWIVVHQAVDSQKEARTYPKMKSD